MTSEPTGTASADRPSDESAEELRLARLELVRLNGTIANLAAELEERERELTNVSAHAARDREQLRHLRTSLSWRLTAPIRLAKLRSRRGND